MKTSIKNPFGIELPQKLDIDDLEYLVRHLRANIITLEEKHEIYMGHVRLAISIASRYAYRAPHLTHDLVQVAMLAMAEGIAQSQDKLVDNNITPYLSTKMQGAVRDAIGDQGIVTGRAIRKRPDYKYPVYVILKDKHNQISNSDSDYFSIMEAVEQCIIKDDNLARREYKRVIISLRASGYNNAEIADIIELSESSVQNYLADIKRIYMKEYSNV